MPLIFSILDRKAGIFKCIDRQKGANVNFFPLLLSILSIWTICLTSYRSQQYRYQSILLKAGKMAWQASCYLLLNNFVYSYYFFTAFEVLVNAEADERPFRLLSLAFYTFFSSSPVIKKACFHTVLWLPICPVSFFFPSCIFILSELVCNLYHQLLPFTCSPDNFS